MADFKVLDASGNVIGYIVNSKDESEAQKMAKQQEDYYSVSESKPMNAPPMFQNCFMDNQTATQFARKD